MSATLSTATTLPTAAEVEAFLARLAGVDRSPDDSARIELLTALERLKGAAAAAQARVTVAFDASQRAAQAAHGVPVSERGRGVASQVALARRDSPTKGGRHLGLARALVTEMPRTLKELTAGHISEWRATILARETAVLSVEHRRRVDAELGDRLGSLGDRAVEREARRIAYRLDPASVMRRVRGAETDRRVSLRPAPDTMSLVTGFLPVAQGVAVHAALSTHADTLRAAGDPRTRGQIMADTFVERLTGQQSASDVSIEVQLVMTDRALLTGDHTPARLAGHGPIPAALARALVQGTKQRVWVRRLFTSPTTRELAALESRRRLFPRDLRTFLVARDEVCRTPWCDAPIRHHDHVVPWALDGPTSAANGQGLCEACNHAKEAPGWSATPPRAGPGGLITVTTPTGHRYLSRSPDLPGDRQAAPTPAERHFADVIAAA